MMRLYKVTIVLLVIIGVCAAEQLFAQDRLPVREYTPRDAVVALDRSLSFDHAVRILSDYAVRFENKVVLNQSGFSGNVGVSIPGLYWYDALEMVASYNNLTLQEYPDRIEIISARTQDGRPVEDPRAEALQPDRPIFMDTREIEISATFFQGDRQFLREIGVNWTAISNGKVQVSNFAAGSVSEPVFEVSANISEMIETGEWQIDALLNTLESNNKGEILSSPTIKVMDGETGRIQVGQDFSIKQRDFAGNVIDQFFSTGTILTVTPWVINLDDKQFIYMDVRAERSSAQPDAVSTIINKQEANTKILMLDGETTAMAGLYETEESLVRRGIPFLKDLPPWFFGLRYLFGFESKQTRQRELIIVLQAKLVPALNTRSIQDEGTMDFIRRELMRRQQEMSEVEVE